MQDDKRIYLASPYSHPDAAVRVERYHAVCKAAARFARQGHTIFSPIAHGHSLIANGLPIEDNYWQDWCLSFLDMWATDLWVLQLEGWEESNGVAMEIDLATKMGMPIRYIEA